MGFFDKVKRALNIGGAKVELTPPGVLQHGSSFTLAARIRGGKIDQKITGVIATLEQRSESMRYGLNNQKTMQSETIVVAQDKAPGFDLKAGETKEFAFKLKVGGAKGEAAGVMKALDTLNKMATRAHETWELKVVAQVDGALDAVGRIAVKVE